jgi:hypothetical protein
MTDPKPTIGRIVQYRGKQGYQALRAAIVNATVDTLDPRGIEAGDVPALDSDEHVHLWVFSPGERGGFPEYNVRRDEPGMCRPGTWQWPTRS